MYLVHVIRKFVVCFFISTILVEKMHILYRCLFVDVNITYIVYGMQVTSVWLSYLIQLEHLTRLHS